jgi:hypothetical protein
LTGSLLAKADPVKKYRQALASLELKHLESVETMDEQEWKLAEMVLRAIGDGGEASQLQLKVGSDDKPASGGRIFALQNATSQELISLHSEVDRQLKTADEGLRPKLDALRAFVAGLQQLRVEGVTGTLKEALKGADPQAIGAFEKIEPLLTPVD